MRPKAILTGLLSCAALFACAYLLSRWVFPLEPAVSVEEAAILEKVIALESYLMLPVLSAGIGVVCLLAGIERCGVAGALSVLPTVAVFVSGNHGSWPSLGLAVVFVGMAWIIADIAGGRPRPAKGPVSANRVSKRRLLSGMARRKSGRNSGDQPARA